MAPGVKVLKPFLFVTNGGTIMELDFWPIASFFWLINTCEASQAAL